MLAKIKRQFTSVLPISAYRKGSCVNCGQCCRMVFKCPFLKYKNNKAYCLIYSFRPLSCKKYPRTEKECLTTRTCGFKFIKDENIEKREETFSFPKFFKKLQKNISFNRI